MEKRNAVIASVLVLVALAAMVNAAAFAYRWMQGTVTVAPADQAAGAACVGFYSSKAQDGISPTYLPEAGTNFDANTYGNNNISVTTGDSVCQWTDGVNTYNLYESISAEFNLTVGSWYIKDFYGFGYSNATSGGPVTVWIKVETPVSGVQNATLILYNATDGTQVGKLDLTTSSNTSVTLNPGEALQIDLLFDTNTTGTYPFQVGFYANQQSSEPPR
ncbi:hypothetical protein [Thermococcus gorgonarius]|uniref:Uncharacterized protein n=1 Tax=Thermococcus gorgonarius TaxID=71997 RepID=A0A2Z2MFE0_THEGO|nr:hypothetical protein [Thermococcus gorgonarius]ASJ00708.1 hypothetical protein A3K92_04065 [Thermococcus gorgonarius]